MCRQTLSDPLTHSIPSLGELLSMDELHCRQPLGDAFYADIWGYGCLPETVWAAQPSLTIPFFDKAPDGPCIVHDSINMDFTRISPSRVFDLSKLPVRFS